MKPTSLLLPFQLDDLARLWAVPGGILAWDTGLGKTRGAMSLALAGAAEGRPSLIVTPADLHARFRQEASLFGLTLTDLVRGQTALPTGIYLTSFSALGIAGRRQHERCLAEEHVHSFGTVVVDEGVRLKSQKALQASAVRQLQARRRYLLTATPVKNRLGDLFELLCWVAGPRFPVADKGAAAFAREFLVRESPVRGRSQYRPSVANLALLWKALAPIVVRRRKGDGRLKVEGSRVQETAKPPGTAALRLKPETLSERLKVQGSRVKDLKPETSVPETFSVPVLPPRTVHSIPVPMSPGQSAEYAAALRARYVDVRGQTATLSMLQALRRIASGDCASDVPKFLVAVELLRKFARVGEPAVLFSAFKAPLRRISTLLQPDGIRHAILDGDMDPALRSAISVAFREGSGSRWKVSGGAPPSPAALPRPEPLNLSPETFPQVVLCSMDACAEGHDWGHARHVIVISQSWALDRWLQSIDRVWRLNSVGPVNVWNLVTERTIEERLDALRREKAGAADLVLDGALLTAPEEPIDLEALAEWGRERFG